VRGLRAALRLADFGPLLVSYTVAGLTDWLATIALAILVFDKTGDPLATTALFVAAKFLPAAFVPALAALSERLPVRRVLLVTFAVEAAALTVLAFQASAFWLPLVLLLAFVDGTLAALARAVTRAAAVAVLEPAGLLREGNALLSLCGNSGMVLGPVGAGGLVAASGAGLALALAAGLFAALLLVAARTRVRRADVAEPAPWTTELRDGVRHVLGRRVLAVLLLGQGLVLLLLAMTEPIEVILVKEELAGGDTGFGAFVSAWGIGVIIGGVLFARERARDLRVVAMAGTLLMALGYLAIGVAPTLFVAVLVAAAGGVGNGLQYVAVLTALQEATDDRYQTRVAGLFEAVAFAAPGLGFVLGGALAAGAGSRTVFLVAGGGILAVATAALLLAAGTRERFPEAEPASES
jgi:MFS family permease